MKKRVEWIDIAKGICILLVVLGHEMTWEERLRYAIYAFHIPMFFVLSGMTVFITKEAEKDFTFFLKKNINGLLKPYILGSIFYTAFDIIGGGTASFESLRIMVRDVFFTMSCYGINVLWFIITVFIAKIILYWILKVKKNEVVELLVLCVCGIGLVVLLAKLAFFLEGVQFRNLILWTFIGILRPLLAVPFMYMGFVLYPVFHKNIELEENSLYKALMLSPLVLTALIPAFFKMKITMVNMIAEPAWVIMVSGMFGSIGMISICFLLSRVKGIKEILSFFGKNSLTIMLTHEYLQIRSSIQTVCENLIDNRAVILLVTFILVISIETVICVLWNLCKARKNIRI